MLELKTQNFKIDSNHDDIIVLKMTVANMSNIINLLKQK
jgi:hypothetical protein